MEPPTRDAFFGSFIRDYVYQACLETLEEVRRQVPAWRPLQPGGAAQRLEIAATGRVLCGVVSQKQDTTSPQLSGAVH